MAEPAEAVRGKHPTSSVTRVTFPVAEPAEAIRGKASETIFNYCKSEAMRGYMYILHCSDGSYYTGSTNNIEFRVAQHQNGEGSNYTRKRLPVELVYYEEFQNIDDAFYREKQVQGWCRKKKEALISGRFDKLSELSRSQNKTSTVAEPAVR